MALVGNTYLTLKDKLAMTEGGKVTSTIIDLLSNTSSILENVMTVLQIKQLFEMVYLK